MKRPMLLLAALAVAAGCGAEERVPMPGALQALAQNASVAALYAVVTDGSERSYSGEPRLIDPAGFDIAFEDFPSNTPSVYVVILGDVGGTLLPLIRWVQPMSRDGGSANPAGEGNWNVPIEDVGFDFDLDDDRASNFTEVLGNLKPDSVWTTVYDTATEVRGITGMRSESLIVATASGLRYPGNLTVPKYLSNVTTARNVDVPVGRDITVDGDGACSATVDPRSLDFDFEKAFVGGGGGCLYYGATSAFTAAAPTLTARAFGTGVADPLKALSYFGSQFLIGVTDAEVYYRLNVNDSAIAPPNTALTMTAHPTLGAGVVSLDMPATQTQFDPLIAHTATTVTITRPQGSTGICTLDNATALEGTTSIERLTTVSSNIAGGFHAFVVYRRPNQERVVRRLRINLSSDTYASCTGVTVSPEAVVVLPNAGAVTAIAYGTVDAMPTAETGARSLFIADDAGMVSVIENADSWSAASTARVFASAPNNEPISGMIIPTDGGFSGEQALRSLMVATPNAVYRLP